MKKLLLLLILLATAGMIKAQDIYYSGYHTSSNGQQYAHVYLNGNSYDNLAVSSYNCNSDAVFVDENTGDVYWVINYNNSFKIKKNHESSDVISETSAHINRIVRGSVSLFYAVGYVIEDGVKRAAYWYADGTKTILGNTSYNSEITGGYLAYGGVGDDASRRIYFCGYQYTSSSSYEGKVWNGAIDVALTLENVKFYDLVYYDKCFYITGRNSSNVGVVYKGLTLVYELGTNSRPYRIVVDGGDIYNVGYVGTPCVVWKNGEIMYNHNLGSQGYLKGLAVNSEGVYYVGNNDSNGTYHGVIFKDGEELYPPTTGNGEALSDIYVTQIPCYNDEIRTLPYFEGFETGDTDWECWTKIDVDNNNGNPTDGFSASYWDRGGTCSAFTLTEPYEGDHYARHTRNTETAQEGWLISPRLFLQPGRDYTRLKFQSFSGWPQHVDYEGVWISTSDDPTNISAYTELWYTNDGTASWEEKTVSLSQYQGQAVYIAFKYSGTNAHAWNIDNVSVTESWSPCSTPITSFPFVTNFDSNPFTSTCWYLLDNDHTGGMRCWQYDESNHCAKHPDGQNNGINQEGWLITQKLQLAAGEHYTLTFDTKYGYSNLANNKSSVWIALDKSGTPDPADYTQIWTETAASGNWNTVTIDLSEYAGHTVNIAFKYEGIYAHVWYLDNITVNQFAPQFDVYAEANNPAWGTVEGGSTYEQGATATLRAIPNTGYEFFKWTKNGAEVSTDAEFSFTVTAETAGTYTAIFGEPSVIYYHITAEASPVEAGTVTGTDIYEAGATATLAASANAGWQFTQWQDGNTDNPRDIVVTEDANYIALFSQINYTINVSASPAEGGTVTGGGSNYHYGEFAVLTATANEGYEFLNWNDGVNTNERVVYVTEDADYTAYFAAQGVTTYTVTVLSNDFLLGDVEGGGTFPEGTVITIKALPIGFAQFVRWNDGNTNATREVTVTADVTYTAFFEMPTFYTIIVESLNPTMGTATGGGEFPAGAEITIQATPKAGYYFDGWDDGDYQNPRTITVTGNATYRAKFTQQQQTLYTVTVMCNDNEGTTVGTGSYPAGTTIQIAAFPKTGYVFKQWNDGNTDNPRSITVTANVVYFATFVGDAIGENSAQSICLYPNPANDVIRLDGISDNTEVRIYNTVGALVKVVNVSAGEEIRISDLNAGLYIVRTNSTVLRFTKK